MECEARVRELRARRRGRGLGVSRERGRRRRRCSGSRALDGWGVRRVLNWHARWAGVVDHSAAERGSREGEEGAAGHCRVVYGCGGVKSSEVEERTIRSCQPDTDRRVVRLGGGGCGTKFFSWTQILKRLGSRLKPESSSAVDPRGGRRHDWTLVARNQIPRWVKSATGGSTGFPC